MATATQEHTDEGHDAHDDHHPSDAQYWKVGAALAIITLAEVGTYFIADPPYDHELSYLIIGSLIFMMIAKFVTIGAYFMHLKYDHKIFRQAFSVGVVLAVAVYFVVFFAFRYFDDTYEAGMALLS